MARQTIHTECVPGNRVHVEPPTRQRWIIKTLRRASAGIIREIRNVSEVRAFELVAKAATALLAAVDAARSFMNDVVKDGDADHPALWHPLQMRTFNCLGLALAGISMSWASEAAATTCTFDLPPELVEPGVHLGARTDVGIVAAPPGGLWWVDIVDDADTGRCDRLVVRARPNNPREAGPIVEVEVARVGPRRLAIRVPADAEPGSDFNATLDCAVGGQVQALLSTTDVEPLDAPQPSFSVTSVESFEWTSPPCGLGSTETTHHRSFIDVVVDDPSRLLLLDAWLVPPGETRPEERSARVTDAMVLPLDVSTMRIQVSTPGIFDAHLRLTDALTGETSDVVIVPVDTPADEGQVGCAQTAAEMPALLAASSLLASRRRRRSA